MDLIKETQELQRITGQEFYSSRLVNAVVDLNNDTLALGAIPQAGEIWYVKLPGELLCSEFFIRSCTANTISVRDIAYKDYANVYKRCDIDFVERIK